MSQKTRVIEVPAAGGAAVEIRCTQVTTQMSIQEDGSANGGVRQGLVYQPLTSRGHGQVTVGPALTVLPAREPIAFGDGTTPIGNGGSSPYPVSPGGPVTQGTPVCQVTSASENATSIVVTEWN
jgi:hypothetical protein